MCELLAPQNISAGETVQGVWLWEVRVWLWEVRVWPNEVFQVKRTNGDKITGKREIETEKKTERERNREMERV